MREGPVQPSDRLPGPTKPTTDTARASIKPLPCLDVSAQLGKGEPADKLATTILVLDTGAPHAPSSELRTPRDQSELDQLYRDTIKRGIIDHHSIDATVRIPKGAHPRCTTSMIAMAPELVLDQLNLRGVREITSHRDSDLDSLAACYLAQYLKVRSSLPSIAKALAEHVDLVDYGRYREQDPERYAQSVAGAFSCLKSFHDQEARVARGEVFKDQSLTREQKGERLSAIAERAQKAFTGDVFTLLDACEEHCRGKRDFTCSDISTVLKALSPDLASRIEGGKRALLGSLAAFEREHQAATRAEATVTDKQGEERKVPVIIFTSGAVSPLLITNMCYMREPPETIVVVYSGLGRQDGADAYNIGIKTETAKSSFNLDQLAVALSEREGELREPLLKQLNTKASDGTISVAEREKLTLLTTPRRGFETLKIGDPTVCVAEGSLVAASRSSLMEKDDFLGIVGRVLGF